MQRRTETHIFISPPGAAPGAAHVWATPEVRVTWGCITKKVSPTRGITVKPQGGPTPPVRGRPYILQRSDSDDRENFIFFCRERV